jgi:hypothetical protein
LGRSGFLILVATLGLALSSCGPIWSGTLIADATGKYKAAEAADAKNFAPYEYYAAEEYLHKAREKESYSQYQRAVDYGKRALEFATKALEKSKQAKAAYIQPMPQQAKPQAQPPAGNAAPGAQPVPVPDSKTK